MLTLGVSAEVRQVRDRSTSVIQALVQGWKFCALFSCCLLDNSFISVAVYCWKGRYVRPLAVNRFFRKNIINNPRKIYEGICLPFAS